MEKKTELFDNFEGFFARTTDYCTSSWEKIRKKMAELDLEDTMTQNGPLPISERIAPTWVSFFSIYCNK
ncbi:unnamed protein product [Caenorhabditis nigoni]